MIQDKPSSKRKFLLLAARLLLILGLWLGGTYAFEAINRLGVIPNVVPTDVQADGAMNIWWPTNNAKISGLQPFKAIVQDKNISDYTMYWSVDGGQPNLMSDSNTDYPHKESTVDLTSWNWNNAGPYKVTFRALDKSGNTIGQSTIDLYQPGATVGATSNASTQSSNTTTQTSNTSTQSSNPVSAVINQVSGIPQASASETAQTAPVTAAKSSPSTPAYLSVIAPATNSAVVGSSAFRASVDGMNTSDYQMFWQVDNGARNSMYSASSDGRSYKEASVDTNSWSWRGAGPYVIKFTAVKNGQDIASSEVSIYTKATSQTTNTTVQAPIQVSVPQTQQTATQTVSVDPVVSTGIMASAGNPLSGMKFFVNQNSNAKRQADEWRNSRPTDAAMMDKIANSPEATWLGGWSNASTDVSNKISAAKSQGSVPVFIAYNIPNRDCGSYSAGGVNDAGSYASWIQGIANSIKGNKAVVVLEPDSLSVTDCLSAQQKTDRYSMLSNAVSTLKSAGAVVYIDAGHANWIGADDMASRLKSAGIDKADGFALNVSNFYSTSDNTSYGSQVSSKVGGKHFVIDTARNGQGPNGSEWCNPSGRGLGVRSTTNTGNSLVDGYLWLKNPGESDGNCNGGPSAGTWWADYALGLAQKAAF